MTVRIPSRTLGDRILGAVGKKRAVYVPGNLNEEFGTYIYAQAQRENFFKALLRGKDSELKEGWVYHENRRKG